MDFLLVNYVYIYPLRLTKDLPVNSEFQLIHELCLFVLSASQRTELIRATLATLHAFLSWIPLGYIFESPLVCSFYELSVNYVENLLHCVQFKLTCPSPFAIAIVARDTPEVLSRDII